MTTGFDVNDLEVEDSAPTGTDWAEAPIIGEHPLRTQARKIRKRVSGNRSEEPTEPATPQPIPPKPREGQLVKPLTDFYVSIGMMVFAVDQVCGQSIINSAEQCARALETMARENPAARRFIYGLVETSVWGQMMAAHAPIIMTIAAHHSSKMNAAFTGATLPVQENDTVNPNAA